MMTDEVVGETYTGRITRSIVKKLKKRSLSPTPLYFSATRRRTKSTLLESAAPSTTKKRTRASRRSSAAGSIHDERENEIENVDEDNEKKDSKRVQVEDVTSTRLGQQLSNPTPTPYTQNKTISAPTSPTNSAAVSVSSSRVLLTNSNSSKLSPIVPPSDLR